MHNYKGQNNYKVGQLFLIKKCGKIITNRGSSKIRKWGKRITKWVRYFKAKQNNYKV